MNPETLAPLATTSVPTLGYVVMLATAAVALLLGVVGYRLQTRARLADAERRRNEDERVRLLALHDAGTMMRNRASFQQEIVQMIQRCERDHTTFDLFYARLRFPGVATDNERDQAMRALAERIAPLTRRSDLLARYSKTEIALLRPRLHEADQPRQLREQLLGACLLPVQVGERSVPPLAQVGAAHFPADGQHSRQLLEAAMRDPHAVTRQLSPIGLPQQVSREAARVA